MSIPQVCPSCGNNYSEGHSGDCPSWLSWPQLFETHSPYDNTRSNAHPLSEAALKRVMDYLMDEPEESPPVAPSGNFTAITLLKSRAEELRKEAAAISLVDSRAKRNFAADVLEKIIQELVSPD